jgi:PPK2 family polyphosphate:nucleotide phosphotransferase
MKINKLDINKHKIKLLSSIKLFDIKTDGSDNFDSKKDADKILEDNIKRMSELQDMLYAQNKYSLLIIIQAMDTAGKDGIIKHVMSGLNPQGTIVHSFKQPSQEDMDHDYLWRANKCLPERGQIGIFNRSYYEEVLVVKVHDLIKKSQIPVEFITADIWEKRYGHIKNFEQYLHENGTIIIKLFLHISKKEQKNRLIGRIDDKTKNWKFSTSDMGERQYWNDYQQCYEDLINNTSTDESPWYVIPADKKWFARLAVSEIINQTLESLELSYPEISEKQTENLKEFKLKLLNNEA